MSGFVAFRVTFNELCCGLLSYIHLWVIDQSWQTGPNESALHFKVVFFSLLTSNWEVSTGRSLNSFLIISEITKHIVIISFIEDNETSLLIEKHILRVL